MLLDHSPFARAWRAYACIGHMTYDTYLHILYIYQRNSAVLFPVSSLVWGLAHARPNYRPALMVVHLIVINE